MECLVGEYIKFFENFSYAYFKIFLNNKYNKPIISLFVNKYIDVRYYNNSLYSKGYSFIDKLNKELKNVAKEIIKQYPEKEVYVKRIFILMSYLMYFDECVESDGSTSVIDALYSDPLLEGFIDQSTESALKEHVSNFRKTKKEFFDLFENKKFSIVKKRVAYNIYKTDLSQSCNISLYSDEAIDRAFNTGTTLENKTYLLLLMLSAFILKQTVELSYSTKYIVNFPITLFQKSKKMNKYLKVIDNEVVIDRIYLNIDYTTYLENKDLINSWINNGYSMSLVLDESYDENLQILDLFCCVFVYEKYDYYDIIIGNKDSINTKIVSL